LIEVTRDGDIVWEYFNGARDERPEYAAVIPNAKRLMSKNLHFEFNS
jgi:hypothetical protein